MKHPLPQRAIAFAALIFFATCSSAAGYRVVELAVKPAAPDGLITFSSSGALAPDGRSLINATTELSEGRRVTAGEKCNVAGNRCKRLEPKDRETLYAAASADFSRIAGTAKDAEGTEWAVRFKDGLPEYFLAGATVRGVNKKNVVVGETTDGRPYRYDGVMHVLRGVNGQTGHATAINDAGIVVGEIMDDSWHEHRAVRWDKRGAAQELQPDMPVAEGHHSIAHFITADGTVYGESTMHDGEWGADAVRFNADGSARSLGRLGTFADQNYSRAWGANSRGVAVGDSTNSPTDRSFQAVLFANGKVIELATQVSAQDRAKYHFSRATSINEAGQILVDGERTDTGYQTALRLDPLP